MSSLLSRRLRFFERQWPWALWTLATVGFLLIVGVALASGMLEGLSAKLFYRALRGYTPIGVLLGLSSVTLFLLAFLYVLRKRTLQESMPLRGTMMMWLSAHVYLGTLAFITAVAHAGFGTVSWHLSTGKVLLALLFFIVFSGFVWRVVYWIVPKRAAKAAVSLSSGVGASRADQLQVELDKLCAGRTEQFQRLADWVLQQAPSDAELNQQSTTLSADEQPVFAQFARVAASRNRALERQRLQSKFTRRLQSWRTLHVPVTLLFFVVLPIHVFYAYDAPAKMFMGIVEGSTAGGFEKAEACESCHKTIVDQWRLSMHSHAMKSPVMVAQTNQVVRNLLATAPSPDPKEICINCHGPIGSMLTTGATLPLDARTGDKSLLNEGISCAVCHQWKGTSVTGGAGLSKFADGLVPGRTYFGPIADPVPNAFHRSEKIDLFDRPAELCRNCHNVQYDKNGDGKYVKGTDLVLQTLWDEWNDFRRDGGPSCVSCHMPVTGQTDAADSALLVLEQDFPAPDRKVHDHSFIAVDAPIELPPEKDVLHPRRAALLRRAATLEIDADSVSTVGPNLGLEVRISNTGTGHNLPGGFAFVRQMWLEVVATDARGTVVGSSGVLKSRSDDLCDANTMEEADNPMRQFIQGCREADPLLVNFQAELVDRIQVETDDLGRPVLDERGQPKLERAPGAHETWLQHLDGGAVARVRPFDKKAMAPLAPSEGRTVRYSFPVGTNTMTGGTITVRLLFRAVPPYFLRALGAAQPPNETPRVSQFAGNPAIFEMKKISIRISD